MAEVFVVDRAAFFDGRWPQGFVPFAGEMEAPWLDEALRRGRFVDRPTAESTPAWKQWIPYCVLRCASPDPGEDAGAGLLLVRRTKGQSEARLHGAWSIGLGGHVEPVDAGSAAGGQAFFAASLRRELSEELDLRRLDLPAPQFLGLLNDDSTDVGRVHAGLVYRIDLPLPVEAARERLGIREISKMRGGFTHLVEMFKLWQNPAQFESWSQILIRARIADPIGDCRQIEISGQDG